MGWGLGESEGARFYAQIFTELQARGLQRILILCCDGLRGLPEAVETYFPQTVVQTCVVHLISRSLSFVNYKDRQTVVADLKPIYQAATENEALQALEQFQIKWAKRYPMIARSWRARLEPRPPDV